MKHKILSIIKIFIFGMIISQATAMTCHASVDLAALQGYLNGKSQEQINQSNNPKYADRNNSVETIDPLTGNLLLKVTDLYLSGKDGLDLNIGRTYNSSQNECEKKVTLSYQVETKLVQIQGYACDIYYFHSDTNSWEKYVQKFDNYTDAYNFYIAYQTNADGSMYTLSPYAYNWSEYRDVYTVIADNYTDKYSYHKMKYYLGAGWSFNFPSVQVGSTSYYYDGSGNAYEITGYTEVGNSNLKGYQGNDVRFLNDNASFYSGDGTCASLYKFIDSAMTTTYFGSDGRLLGIKDRFNNTIKFWYQNFQIYDRQVSLISKIQDSIGRIVTFTYTGNDIILTVTAPGTAQQLTLTYGRLFQTTNMYKNGTYYETYQYPILDHVTDVMGRTTQYINYYGYNNNVWPSTLFSFYSKTINTGSSDNLYLLGGVEYPGSLTRYEYEKTTRNLGTTGATEAYRIKSRYDRNKRILVITGTEEWLPAENKVDYTYSGDFTGYPNYNSDETMPETYNFWSQEAYSNGMTIRSIFNGYKQEIQIETTAANNEKRVVKNLEFNGGFRYLPTKVEAAEYSSDGALARVLYTSYSYNSMGCLLESTLPLTLQRSKIRVQEPYILLAIAMKIRPTNSS